MEDKKLTKKQGKYKNILNNLLDIGGVDQAIYTYVNGSKSFDVFSKFGGEVNRTILRNKDFEIRMDEKDLIQLSLMLKRSTTADEIISLYQRFNERLFKTKIALLKQPKHFDATRAELIARLEKKVHSKRTRWLQYINDARSINIQENVWPLHVATLFVSIKTKKRELFAPLLLRPVDAELDGKKIVIKTAGDWVINEKLLFILNQQGHKLKDDFSLKGMTGLSAINTALREWNMKEMFTPYGIFKNKKKDEVVNTDFIQHHGIVLGFFKPNGGQLRKTMFKIIHNNQVDKVLASNKSHKPFDERVNSYIKNNALDLVRIEHSNHSQDKALISSMIQDTIIWGPPGTGKSQVISNIIANILYKGKSAVIMSQKKAALDVLKDRLGAISQFTLFLLNDNNNDKKSFYAPMFKLLKTIRAFKPNEEELNHSYPLISPQEIKGVDLLNRLKKSRDNKTTLLKAKETGKISSLNYREACDYFNRNIEKKLDTKFLVDTLSKNIISKIGTWKEKEPIKFSQFEQCIIDIEEMKLLPIKFIDEYKPLLKEIFPVVISTPETSFVTWEKGAYDYAVLDESSQMFLEIGLPPLYIGKIKVLVGDQQQMKPSRWFSSRDDSENVNKIPEDAESLLDYGFDKNMYPVMLNKNYRSASASLMSFSAKNFYESELDVINSATAKDGDAIQVVNVEGIWAAGVNKVEVEEIIKLATKNIDKYEKVIILAFNSAQRVLIEKVIIERKPKLFKALRQEKLLIRNIENIQGDEADLVLISVVYTPKTNVGSTYVARAGGRNALNVALSRAKEKMIIVKSVGFDTIREAKSEDFKTFKEWLRFLDLEVIEQREYSLIKDKLKVENDNEDYNLKEDIFEDLTESFKAVKNVKVVKDYPIGSKSIDVALVNSTGNIIMGIEADTYEYSNVKGFDGYLEDISRFEFLEVKGYSMFRVKLYEWLLERNKVVRQLKAKLKQLRK